MTLKEIRTINSKAANQMLLVRIGAGTVFLTLVISLISVILFPNPGYPVLGRILTAVALFALTYLGGVCHGILERRIVNVVKTSSHNGPQ